MIYCDTSLLVAALTSEAHSQTAQAWLTDNAGVALAVSDWVITEFASALAMKECRGAIDPSNRREVERQWHAMLDDTLTVFAVRADHFAKAAALVDNGRNGLRAGDALHLRSASTMGFRW